MQALYDYIHMHAGCICMQVLVLVMEVRVCTSRLTYYRPPFPYSHPDSQAHFSTGIHARTHGTASMVVTPYRCKCNCRKLVTTT